MNRQSTVIVIIIAVAAVIGAAFAIITITDNHDARSYTVTYYSSGEKLLHTTVPSGTYVTVYGDLEKSDHGRFVGWNTKQDMSGKTLSPGSQLKVDGNISLYAVILGSGMFAVLLPEEQKGYNIGAEPSIVAIGGSSVLSYVLLPGYVDDELVVAVNGNPIKLDAMKKIHLADITDDQWVTVSGVYDMREHNISLPQGQHGYVLTSSAEKVHHGESYSLEYRLLPGFRESYDFGIHVNGGETKMPSGGTLLIEDVRDNHLITVTGVELIDYVVSAGKNISVLVNGVHSSVATIEDFLTVVPDKGYVLPDTFVDQIKGDYSTVNGGYRITSAVSFPAVLKITAGDNIGITNIASKTIFVCPADAVKITPASGYSLPGDYINTVKEQNGVKYTVETFYFNNDAEFPSIYKVVFNGYNKVHATFFVIGGTIIPQPQNEPERLGYYFNKWDTNLIQSVVSDLSVIALWDPITHDVYFGPNLVVFVGVSKSYSFNEGTDEPPRTIQIKTDEKVVIKTNFDLDLPSNYGPINNTASYRDGYYEIFGDSSFPGVTFVNYKLEELDTGTFISATIGGEYTILLEPTEKIEGYYFTGWMYKGKLVYGQMPIENKTYILYASWSPVDG